MTVTLLVVRPPYRSLHCRNTSAPPFPAVSKRRPNTSILQQRTQTPRGFSPNVWSSVQMVNIFLVLEPECPHLRPGSWVYCASRNMGRFGCRTRKSLVSTLFCLLVSLVPSRVLRTRGPTSGALGNTWAQLGPSDPDQTRHPQPRPGEHPCLLFSTSASSTPVLTILPLPTRIGTKPSTPAFSRDAQKRVGRGVGPRTPLSTRQITEGKRSQLVTLSPLFPSLLAKGLRAGAEDPGSTCSVAPATRFRTNDGTTALCLGTRLSPRVTRSEVRRASGASASVRL